MTFFTSSGGLGPRVWGAPSWSCSPRARADLFLSARGVLGRVACPTTIRARRMTVRMRICVTARVSSPPHPLLRISHQPFSRPSLHVAPFSSLKARSAGGGGGDDQSDDLRGLRDDDHEIEPNDPGERGGGAAAAAPAAPPVSRPPHAEIDQDARPGGDGAAAPEVAAGRPTRSMAGRRRPRLAEPPSALSSRPSCASRRTPLAAPSFSKRAWPVRRTRATSSAVPRQLQHLRQRPGRAFLCLSLSLLVRISPRAPKGARLRTKQAREGGGGVGAGRLKEPPPPGAFLFSFVVFGERCFGC